MTELIKFCQLFCIFSYGYGNVNLDNTAVESVARQEVWRKDWAEIDGAGPTGSWFHRQADA